MDNTNVCVLGGNLTRDAELKYLNSGTALCKFSIANNYSMKKGDNWENQVNYADIVLWGKSGEALAQYLIKGTGVIVSCAMRQNRWTDDNGNTRSKIEFHVNRNGLEFKGNKGGGNSGNNNNSGGSQNNQSNQRKNEPAGPPGYSKNDNIEDFEDDIPF